MDVLTAVGVAPLQIHKTHAICDRRNESRNLFCFNPFSPQQFSLQPSALNKSSKLGYLGAAAASFSKSTFGDPIAHALTYEEALEQSIDSSSYVSSSVDFDVGSLIDSVANFTTENPLVVAGGFAALAIPLVLSLVLGKNKSWGVESAKSAYAKLGEDGGAQLLDIRELRDIKEVGSPNIKSLKKRVISIAYGGDNEAFLKKMSAKFKDPSNTTLFILDKFDGNSGKVAELITSNGFKAGFTIKDGVRGWMNSGLPWLQPIKGFKLDFSNLTEAVNDALRLQETDLLPSTLGLAAATGLGVLAFSEIETVLQLLGSAAVVQFTISKLLFAEDRKVTLRQINEFLNTKVAPEELSDEIKLIGKAFLPIKVETAVEVASKEAEPEINVAVAEERAEVEAKTSVTETPVNPFPSEESISPTLPQIPRPLSPYPCYPDFKPPTSPSPSKP